MEFFNKAKSVRLKSHLNKFLVADDDEKTVRQHEDGSMKKARWMVELVEGNPHAIRLKGCHGRYLIASDESFLLGWTGKKVIQSFPDRKRDASIEWEPINEGYKVKLRTKGGKFLRANGATPPWRNSITHDLPHRTATQDWVLWDVEVVDISVLDDEYLPNHTSNSPSMNESHHKQASENRRLSSVNVHENRRLSSVNKCENRRLSSVIACENRRPSMGSDRSIKSGRQVNELVHLSNRFLDINGLTLVS